MNTRLARIIGLAAASALALTACGATDGSDAEGTTANDAGSSGEPIDIGLFSGDEGYAVTYLWKAILEDEGYDVNITQADHGPVFQGISAGDLDLAMDVWLPITHEAYLEQYGDSIDEIAEWYDDAKLTIAVNADAPIDSLEELNENADYFDGRLIGIEAGAGLTAATQDEVIPAYGLTDIEFQVSSTPAMLAELQSADADDRPVAVTLWRPHWAYDAFDIKDLEDPEGALGDAESLYIYGSETFRDDHPEVTEWLEGFSMDAEQLHSLENIMFNENPHGDALEPAVRDWIDDNTEFVDSLTD